MAKGKRDGSVYIDPHKLRGAFVFRYREHGLAGLCFLYKERKPDHNYDAGENRHQRQRRNDQLPSCQRQSRQLHHRGEGFCICPEYQKGDILKQIADANRGNQHRQGRRSVPQRTVSHSLNHHAQHRTGHYRQQKGRYGRRHKRRHGGKHHIRSDQDYVSVGKVQHLGNSIYHGITQGDNGILRCQG